MKISKYAKEQTTRVAIFGLSGSGKSSLAAALSKKYNLKWFDLENSIEILRRLPPDQQDRIDYIRIPDSATFPIASETLLVLFKAYRGNVCYGHGKLNCPMCIKEGNPRVDIDFNSLTANDIVVIDTATQLSASLLAHLCKDKPVDYKPQRDEWGALRKYTEWFKSQWQAVPFNIVVLFHTLEAQMDDKAVKLVPNFGSRDMSTSIGGAFTHVIYTEVKNKSHRSASSSTYSNSVLTKSRSEYIAEQLPAPDLIPLFDMYQNNDSVPQDMPQELKSIVTNTSTDPQSPGDIAIDRLAALKRRMGKK